MKLAKVRSGRLSSRLKAEKITTEIAEKAEKRFETKGNSSQTHTDGYGQLALSLFA
jgi:hypothetical protein